MFSNDRPIQKFDEDLFGRSEFAKSVAKAIVDFNKDESLVISINGDWGSGKTSVINLIKNFCDQEYDSKVRVLNFNPWYYSDRSNLILKFFDVLAGGEYFLANSKKKKKLYNTIGNYASNFENLASLVPYASGGFKAISQTAKQLSQKYERNLSNIEEQKKQIRELFHAFEYKVLIIIDDIDRLTSQEIRDIFQLVKIIADIPNLVFLLSFDYKVVTTALNKIQEGKGSEYLEKIVQIPFQLPMYSKSSLEKYLFSQINKILDKIPQERFENNRWIEIYREGVRNIIQTPRHVNRFINVLSFDFNIVADSVNIVDLLGITIIKVFEPELYNIVKSNKKALLKMSDDKYSTARIMDFDDKNVNYKALLNSIFEGIKISHSIRNILLILFPNLYIIFGEEYSDGYSENETEYRKKQRICNEINFEIYFMLSLPDDIFTNSQMDALLGLDELNFKNKIIQLNEDQKIIPFLDRIEDIRIDVSLEKAPMIINSFLDFGDKFVNFPNSDWLYSIETRIYRIVFGLLLRYPNKSERYSILKGAIEKSENSLNILVQIIAANSSEHGMFGRVNDKRKIEEQLLVEKDVCKLNELGHKKINEAFEKHTLIEAKGLPYILSRWLEWGGKDEFEKFKNECYVDVSTISKLLSNFLTRVSVQSGKGIEQSSHYEMYYNDLRKLFDIQKINEILNNASKNEIKKLDEKYQIAINVFRENYEGKVHFRR